MRIRLFSAKTSPKRPQYEDLPYALKQAAAKKAAELTLHEPPKLSLETRKKMSAHVPDPNEIADALFKIRDKNLNLAQLF